MARGATINVSLTAQQLRLVRKYVNSGQYGSASEVVREGLRMLLGRDRRSPRTPASDGEARLAAAYRATSAHDRKLAQDWSQLFGPMARQIIHPRRGEIWPVNFDPTVGAGIQKTRPAMIIQNDVGNRVSQITIVAAITSTFKRAYPFQVSLSAGEGGLDMDSVVTLNHIRSIDRQRLVRKLGMASQETMKAVDEAICVSLGVDVSGLEAG